MSDRNTSDRKASDRTTKDAEGNGPPTVEARGLSKWYGQVAGLTNLDVKIHSGIVGLLGPNGAGKTTFMRLLTGQLQPSVGELRVFGQPVWNNPRVLRRLGYCPEHDGAWNEMSGFEFVEALGRFSGLDKAGAERAARRAIGAVGMTESAGRRLGTFSKGMKQRIKLAQAIAADPDLLVLDEPLTGCDPVARASIIQLIQGLGRAGKTVLVSSHVLHEVEEMTEEILLIHHGQLLAQGKVHALRDLIDEHPHRIRVVCDRPRELAARLAGHETVRSVTMEKETLTVETPQSDRCYPEVSRAALELGVKVSEITSPDDNLEAVFRYLTSLRFGKNRHD